jgi:peptidoglycan hydrolase-like protein with peptidoglycan-binding domain
VDNAEALANEAVAPVEDAAAAVAGVEKPTGKQIQQALKNAGFYAGKIDGEIGPKTKKAIESFQAQNGLKADGKVGRKTWKALSAHLNKAAEVVNPSAEAQAVGQ